jgi:hypothetical protein
VLAARAWRCPRHRQAWRERCGVKESFERALREHAADYVREEVRKANDPMPDEELSPTSPGHVRASPLFVIVRQLLVHADEDFRRPALDRMVASARKETRRYWELGRRYWASTVGEGISEIRLPENTRQLEDEFWKRVDAAVRQALEGRWSRPRKKGRGRAGGKQEVQACASSASLTRPTGTLAGRNPQEG